MNAARVCKLRNGVNKMLQILLFLMAKGGTRTQRPCQLRRDQVFKAKIGAFTVVVNCEMKKKDLISAATVSKLLYNWQVKNKEVF